MALVAHATGTQTATVTTEHFLTSPAVAGVFVCQVDLAGMQALDVLELRVYKMAISGGTARILGTWRFEGVQVEPLIWQSPPIPNTITTANAVRFSLKQTYGTSRDFPWSVYNLEDNSEGPKLDTIDDFLDLEIAAIKAKTDNLPTDPADASDIAASFATLQAFVDTEVASILTAVDTEIATIIATIGALNDAAADGDPTATDTMMAYLKQLINTLVGTAGIPTYPASAAPGNAVSLAEAIRQIYDEVAAISGGSIPSVSDISTEIWDTFAIETGWTGKELMRLFAAVLLGKVSGAGTTTNIFRDINDNKDRVTATVDSAGNRSAVTKDAT